MKTYDPVGTLLDIYENNILNIDYLLSLNSLFIRPGIYLFEVFVRVILDQNQLLGT
jgi:hypothetical protein